MDKKPHPHTELGFSPDALVERKAELLALLKQAAPEIVSDNQIDIERLKTLLGEEGIAPAEHYELTWAGKSAARAEIQKSSSHTLLPSADNPSSAPHMLIEGENLEVLRVLQKSYHSKVKMIYIDPPYNTGNDSFVYPDDYSETLDAYHKRTGEKSESGYLNKQSLWKKNSKESGQYHSAWLSMMYPRIYLSRNLLRDDGVIAIHIDEHEYSNLEILLSEVFGEENNLGTIVWDKRNPKGDSKGIACQHEYIIFFAKNKELFTRENKFVRQKHNATKMLRKADAFIKEHGVSDVSRKKYKEWVNSEPDLSGGERAYSLIDDNGDVYRPVSMAWPNKTKAPDEYFLPLKHPKTGKNCPVPERGWRNPPLTMQRLLDNNMILFGVDETVQPTRKYILKDNMDENVPSLLYFGGSDDALLKTLKIDFDTPKVVDVAKKLISPIVKKGEIVIDFFAGSGTTAQAVMELNIEDNGGRQFICVQLPEPLEGNNKSFGSGCRTIADITRDRINKVIEKLKAEYSDKTVDLACSHFTLAHSNFKVWNGAISDTTSLRSQLQQFQQAEKPQPDFFAADTPETQIPNAERQEAMLAELLLKHGIGALGVQAASKPVVVAGVTIHRVLMADDLVMWICFEPYNAELKDEIVKAKPAKVLLLNSCFVGNKADELIANLQLELAGLDIDLTVI